MRRSLWLLTGLALLALFLAYALTGIRTTGPRDKIAQLVLLLPATVCIAWWLSKHLKKDVASSLKNTLFRIPSGLFVPAVLLLCLVSSSWVALEPLEATAKGGDEFAYLFQARIFARGKLEAPMPPVEDPERFFPSRHLIMDRGMWFSQYPPVHSLMMAPFAATDISWLLGPIEGTLTLLGLFLLIRLWAGQVLAKVSMVLLLLSPFFLLMTASHMAHNTNLLLVTWALYLLSLHWRRGALPYAVGAGLLMGLALGTKPFPIAAWGVFLLILLLPRGRKGIRTLIGLLLGAIPPAAGMLFLNNHYTGQPLRTAYDISREGRLLGFGANRAYYPVYGDYSHTVWRGIKNVAIQVGVGTLNLFGWPFLSLIPLAASLLGLRRDRRVIWLFLPLALMSLLLVAHFWPATIYGPRHYYTFLPVIIALTILGLRSLIRIAREKWGAPGGSFVLLTTLGLFCVTLFIYLPEEISRKSGPWLAVDTEPVRAVREAGAATPALIFMEASDHGYPNLASGMNFTSPFLDGDYVFCVHQEPEEDMEMMAALTGRSPYLFWMDADGPHAEPWSMERALGLMPSRELHPEPRFEVALQSEAPPGQRADE